MTDRFAQERRRRAAAKRRGDITWRVAFLLMWTANILGGTALAAILFWFFFVSDVPAPGFS